MLIYANYLENNAADLIFIWKLQKLSAKNFTALKCESRKQNVGYHGTPHLMQLCVKYNSHII